MNKPRHVDSVVTDSDLCGCKRCSLDRVGAGPVLDRVKSKCSVDLVTGCWSWTGYVDRSGNGAISLGGKTTMVARAVWDLGHMGEPLDSGHVVVTTCQNRLCCAPEHLVVKTRSQLVMPSAKNWRKLTDRQVREVGRMHRSGAPSALISQTTGIHRRTVEAILEGRTYVDVPR